MAVRKLLFVLFMIGFITVQSATWVNACSGGSPLTIAGLINNSDYLVKARPVEIDDLGQNAILQVESYLAGGPGPEFLLLVRTDPVLLRYVEAGRSSGGDCLGLDAAFEQNQTVYMFLTRHQNGSYGLVTTLFNPYIYTFPEPDSTQEVFLHGGVENGGVVYEDYANASSGQKVTESEFLDIIQTQTGKAPTEADATAPYPLKAPLQIITDDPQNNRYMLPVDGHDPVLLTPDMLTLSSHPMYSFGFSDAGTCSSENCTQISSDNLNIAVQSDPNTLSFTWGNQLTGQGALFSTTGDAVAVWNECNLTLYTTGYPRLYETWYEITELNSVSLRPLDGCASFPRLATWSQDGRMLAYSDGDGLWLWDVFSVEDSRRLLLPANQEVIPTARYFSPLGRYLAITQGDRRQNLDLISGAFLPDGIISPDDRLLLKFETEATPSELEICSLAPFSCQSAAGMYLDTRGTVGEVQRFFDLPKINTVRWQDSSNFLALACVSDEDRLCSVFRWYPESYGWYGEFVSAGYDFDYDAQNKALAIVTNTHSILVNDMSVDMATSIQGDIMFARWMPSLFYRN